MTSSNLKVNVKSTNKLYYDRYKYCASAFLPYASTLRKSSHEHIDKSLELRRNLHQSYPDLRALVNGQYLRNPPITEYVRDDLHNFLDQIINTQEDYKIVFQRHSFYCYTNSSDLVDQVLKDKIDSKIVQIKLTHNKGTIVKKKSDYQYRCYLKNKHVSEHCKDNMRKFFNTHSDISTTSGFQQWLRSPYKYTSSHHFFDYNDKGMQILFELIAPGLVREVFTIITEDELNNG